MGTMLLIILILLLVGVYRLAPIVPAGVIIRAPARGWC